MHEPPAGMEEGVLRDALAAQYGLEIAEVSFLPIGHDPEAWVFRAEAAGGERYFAKLRLSVRNPAALLVPRHLYDQGVRQVVAPLATQAGALWGAAGTYALILYPFVESRSGLAQGMTTEQWRAYGAALRQIHAAPLNGELAPLLRRDTFAPGGVAVIGELERVLGAEPPAHAEAAGLAAEWQARRETIATLVRRVRELGEQLAQARPPLLLCHADIHTGNVLVDPAGQLWIVDWDEALLAPRERDLMFAAGGISAHFINSEQEGWFFEGYGPVVIDPIALAYYRAAWAVEDIASFGAEICLRPDLGPATRQAALRSFAGLFAPGEIVSIALGSALPG